MQYLKIDFERFCFVKTKFSNNLYFHNQLSKINRLQNFSHALSQTFEEIPQRNSNLPRINFEDNIYLSE